MPRSRLQPALLLVACLTFTSFCCPSSHGKSPRPRLDPTRFSMQNETLTSRQKKAIYLKLIENSIGWVHQSDKFIETDRFEPGGGYYDAAGSGVSWARGNSNICLAYALLLAEFPQRQTFSIYNVPREQMEKRLRQTIRSVCLANKNCSRYKEGPKPRWGGPSWQPALKTIGWAWGAHLVEDSLDADTLALVREVTGIEADNLDKEIPSGNRGNTRAEDCAWNAPLLAWAANKYADDPRAARWDELSKKWAINMPSTAADAKSNKMIDGRPLKDWTVSENAYPDLTIENHGFWSVGYQCAQQHFGEAVLAYHLFGKPVPEAFSHHADQMWADVTSALYLWDGDIFYAHGQDWSWKVYSSINYLCWQNCCRKNRDAGAYESRALQMVYRRQLSIGTGDLGAKFSKHLNFGNQTTKMKRWAFCYLMHKHLGEPSPTAFEEAEKGSLGYHLFPYLKTAIHRTPKKCVSVTWHPRFQPTFVLPAGNSTFTDPPLFILYDRQAGNVRVQLVATKNRVISKHQNPKRPASMAADGKLSTFWVSGPGSKNGSFKPIAKSPDWIQLDYDEPFTASAMFINPRKNYGPRDCELSISQDGKQFESVATFTVKNTDRQIIRFPKQTARHFRLHINSAYDSGSPQSPRNAQICEIKMLDPLRRTPPPALVKTESLDEGKSMEVWYQKPHLGGIVTQWIAVYSLSDEATVYLTAFEANENTQIKVGSLFRQTAGFPPGFEKPIRQYRGKNWLNMSDHLGFVSTAILPAEISENQFLATKPTVYSVKRGEWFAPVAIVTFAGQTHDTTESRSKSLRLEEGEEAGVFTVTLESSDGTTQWRVDFRDK